MRVCLCARYLDPGIINGLWQTGIESNGTGPKMKKKKIKSRKKKSDDDSKSKEKVWRQLLASNGVACNIWLTFKASNQILRIQSKDSWFSILNVPYVVATNEARECKKKPNHLALLTMLIHRRTHTKYKRRRHQECQWHRFHYLIQIPVVLPGNVSLARYFFLLWKGEKQKARAKRNKSIHWRRREWEKNALNSQSSGI